jgi:hypothetical protein
MGPGRARSVVLLIGKACSTFGEASTPAGVEAICCSFRNRDGALSALFQRICCFLFMRLAMISLTELSTKAVEIGSPFRRRAA